MSPRQGPVAPADAEAAALVRAWQGFTDSAALRRLTRDGVGRRVVRSAAYRRLLLGRNRALAAHALRHDAARESFAAVRTFTFFVGHNKSGASLLGGLLDAHRDVVLADEADALQYVRAGLPAEQVYFVLARASRAEARKGRVTARRLEPYSYAVPGAWQGRAPRPLVVGDSTTGTTTRRLAAEPALLELLARRMPGVEVRAVQVVRNPFDPISAMAVRGRRDLADAVERYFAACEALVGIRAALGSRLLEVRYETFVAGPEEGLRHLCAFLGVEAGAAYLSACAAIVRPVPDRSRHWVAWSRDWIDTVERRAQAYGFLEGYTHAS